MNIFHTTFKRLVSVSFSKLNYRRLVVLSKTFSRKKQNILVLGLVPIIPSTSAQIIGSDEEDKSSFSNLKNYLEEEKTPWERVKAIYQRDEYGNLSKELVTTSHAFYLSLFLGMIYGGVLKSRIAFIDFMERNQATIFENHIDAKRKLQNHVTIHFAKGAFQWGWRLAAFTSGFVLTFLTIHAYRGTAKYTDYAVSGALIGSLMRIKLGPPGIIVGGAVGGVLGLFCGIGNTSILNLFGGSIDDILETQYKVDYDRSKILAQAKINALEESSGYPQDVIEKLRKKDEQ